MVHLRVPKVETVICLDEIEKNCAVFSICKGWHYGWSDKEKKALLQQTTIFIIDEPVNYFFVQLIN